MVGETLMVLRDIGTHRSLRQCSDFSATACYAFTEKSVHTTLFTMYRFLGAMAWCEHLTFIVTRAVGHDPHVHDLSYNM